MSTRILLAGGYGNAGFLIAKYLCRCDLDITLTIAGRNAEKAKSVAALLEAEKPSFKINHLYLDLSKPDVLAVVLPDFDLLLLASSTIEYVDQVTDACLQANTDYYDIQISSKHKLNVLEKKHQSALEKDLCFITDGGFHPGILAAMVRLANTRMQELHRADVYVALKIDWGSMEVTDDTKKEFLEELSDYSNQILDNGTWKKTSSWKTYSFDFGEPVHKTTCMPIYFPEMENLPASIPSLKNSGVYISGFNPITDYFFIPLVLLGLKILPKSSIQWLSRAFWWSLKFCKPPFMAKVAVECRGLLDSEMTAYSYKLEEEDSYKLTAIPVIACLLQYLEGTIRNPGLHYQSTIVEPERFFNDIHKMGIHSEETYSKIEHIPS